MLEGVVRRTSSWPWPAGRSATTGGPDRPWAGESDAGCTAALKQRTPKGNRNASEHGRYTAEAITQRRMVAALFRACRDQLGGMRDR